MPGTLDTSSDRDRDNFQQLPIVSGVQSPQQQQYLVREGRPGMKASALFHNIVLTMLIKYTWNTFYHFYGLSFNKKCSLFMLFYVCCV